MFTQMLRLGLIAGLALGVGGAFAAAPKSINDLYADVARLAPGFGGLFVNPDLDTLYVYLLEDTPEAVAALEAAFTAVFADKAPKQSRLVVLQGQYSFLDLMTWYDRMSGVVGGIPGVTLTGIRHSRNRLEVGVATEEIRSLVEQQLALFGIPREAVIIEQHPPVKFDSSLQDLHRPLVGGLQISHTEGIDELKCTLGFNAVRNGVPGFVTVSHCTADPGGVVEPVEPTVFYQPSLANRIGVETVDPRYRVTHADDSRCPLNPDGTTRNCRYSDSAFARREIGVEADRGFIANADFNSSAWSGPTFRIVGGVTNMEIAEGDHVNKVGRTTGRTRGTVTRVCFDVPTSITNVTLICQFQADYISNQGDSGAPVFNIIDTLSPNVRLYGIHWGGNGWFSPIENIQRADFELGPLTKCAPGFGC